jgi:hypothetical protein
MRIPHLGSLQSPGELIAEEGVIWVLFDGVFVINCPTGKIVLIDANSHRVLAVLDEETAARVGNALNDFYQVTKVCV